MTHAELCGRTKAYAVAVLKFARQLDSGVAERHAAAQLIRASASVAANYRAADVARSHKEFIAKLGQVIEEADECTFWFQYLAAFNPDPGIAALEDEGRQLTRIFTASRNTARRNVRTR